LYANRHRSQGYLDGENRGANGPEHYFASCEPERIMAGTYVVSLANCARATGRLAAVQISSWNNGVLGTKSISLGRASGATPKHFMFQVEVTEDPQTGKFDVA